jgi:hypothetical protein
MLLEDQRYLHEDLERLEQAVADRVAEEPRNVSLHQESFVTLFANSQFYRFVSV